MRRDGQPLTLRQKVILGARAVGVMLTAAAAFEGAPAAPVAAASPRAEVSADATSARSRIIPMGIDFNKLGNCQWFRDNLKPDGNVTKATIKLVSRLQGGNPHRVVEYRVSRYNDDPATGQVVVARHYGERQVEAKLEDANNNPVGTDIVFRDVPSDRTVSNECADGSENVPTDSVKARTQVRKMDGTWADTNPPHIYVSENTVLPDYKTIVQEDQHPAECTCPIHTPVPVPTLNVTKPNEAPVLVPAPPREAPVPTGLPGSGNKIIQELP